MSARRIRKLLAVATSVAAALFIFAISRTASAYPWMIRHEYTQCSNCHADPAGGGLLNTYGRAQGEILMRMRYGSPPDDEPGPLSEPLWGLLKQPPNVLVGGSARYAYLRTIPLAGESQGRFILMQADLLGQYSLGRFRTNASVGYVSEGGNGAALSRSDADKIVSRVHWVGVDLGKHDEVLVRAGRMNLPFGIRSIEHTRLVRRETRTDINASQQYGVAADYHRGALRGGVMAIAGNFAVSPDRFRSRGYAGYAEYAPLPALALGVSSMAVRTELDLPLLTPTWRHAHGPFVRYSPFRAVVLTGEFDFLHTSQPTPGGTFFGGVGMVNIDAEPIQGFHLGSTFEAVTRDFDARASTQIWGSAWWFFLPHADLRFDAISNSTAIPGGGTSKVLSALVQVHVYL